MSFSQRLTGNMLDIFTKVALVALVASMLGMLVQHEIAVRRSTTVVDSREEELSKMQQRKEQDTKLYHEVAVLLTKRQYKEAGEKLAEVQSMHPNNPASFLWQARLQYEEGMLAESLGSYRQAIDQEPGYIDRTSPLFEGKSIKQKVESSQEKLQREMQLKPGDMSVKKALDDLLYLKRRLAGGCE